MHIRHFFLVSRQPFGASWWAIPALSRRVVQIRQMADLPGPRLAALFVEELFPDPRLRGAMQRTFQLRPRTRLATLIVCLIPAGLAAQTQTPPSAETDHVIITPELRGDLAMARQQYIDAIADYRDAPANNAEIWNKLGIAYHHLFAMDEARRDYLHALKLRPKYPEALNNLGAIFYARRSYRKAEKYYLKALALDPKQPSIYSNLGTAYFADGKMEKGMDAFRSAFSLDPDIFSGNSQQLVAETLPARDRANQDFCIAKLLAQSGHFPQAISYLRKALDEGFDNRKQIMEDRTLASLRSTPEFSQLMAEQKLR